MMDRIDRELLAQMQQDGRLSYAELGQRVGLSVSAVNERLKKLQRNGVIRGFVALIDPRKMGMDVCAFVQVLIDEPRKTRDFLARVREMPEVQECHHITGEYAYLLKVRVRNTPHLEGWLTGELKSLPGVVRTHSTIVLSTAKETPAIGTAEPRPTPNGTEHAT